jgi:hypothetical protein
LVSPTYHLSVSAGLVTPHEISAVVPRAVIREALIDCDDPATIAARWDSMTNLGGVVQMLKEEHERLTKQMKAITAALSAFGAAYGKQTGTQGRMSAAGRARIAAAQRARWAKVKAKSSKGNVVTMPKKRTMSAGARRKIAAAQRLRWAKVKAAKKTA